jgi:hypothetical protein
MKPMGRSVLESVAALDARGMAKRTAAFEYGDRLGEIPFSDMEKTDTEGEVREIVRVPKTLGEPNTLFGLCNGFGEVAELRVAENRPRSALDRGHADTAKVLLCEAFEVRIFSPRCFGV